jgi:hypothetical protein
MWRSTSLLGLHLFLIMQAKPFTASVVYFNLRPTGVTFAEAAHPNVCSQVHFAAPAWLLSRLRKPNQVSRFRGAHFANPILTHQIVSSFMLLLRPRNARLCCGSAQLEL